MLTIYLFSQQTTLDQIRHISHTPDSNLTLSVSYTLGLPNPLSEQLPASIR